MVRKPSHVDAGSGEENKERKGLGSPEEDERLFNQITRHGVSTWSSVSQLAGKKIIPSIPKYLSHFIFYTIYFIKKLKL
jgi:hypothetical protein